MLKLSSHFNELTEAFDKPYKFRKQVLYKGYIVYRFIADDKSEIDVLFKENEISDDESTWDVTFERGGSTEVTGEGDAMRVFATVIAIIKDFVKKRNPKLMGFSAFKDVFGPSTAPGKGSREKLYDRMLQRYAGKMGYKYYKVSGVDKTEFELRRK